MQCRPSFRSTQAPVVHPDKLDLFPGVSKGGGFQLWTPTLKGPPLRAPPGDTLPGIDAAEGRHIIGKVRLQWSRHLLRRIVADSLDVRRSQASIGVLGCIQDLETSWFYGSDQVPESLLARPIRTKL